MRLNQRPSQNEILSQEEPAYVDDIRQRVFRLKAEPSKSLEGAIAAEMEEHGNYHEWLVQQVGYGPRDQDEEASHMNYEKAKEAPNGVFIMSGDYGGQVYMTCPMRYVQCNKRALRRLLKDIDSRGWGCNEGDGADLLYLQREAGQGVWGGMGGGIILDGLWVHEEFGPLKDAIWRVLQGKAKSLKEIMG
jgi:hypothetical protein